MPSGVRFVRQIGLYMHAVHCVVHCVVTTWCDSPLSRAPFPQQPGLSLRSLSRDECYKKTERKKKKKKKEKRARSVEKKRNGIERSPSHRSGSVRILFARGKRNTEFRPAEAYRADSQKCRINVIIANYTRSFAPMRVYPFPVNDESISDRDSDIIAYHNQYFSCKK